MPRSIRIVALAAAALLLPLTLAAAPRPEAAPRTVTCTTTLWTSGTGGYTAYRIPAVVNVRGTLVAVAEGRVHSSSDDTDTDVLMRRSTDGGCTWSPSVIVADDGTATVGNPTPVVSAGGGLALLTNRQGAGVTQDDIQAGTESAADGRRVFIQTSRDAGATWSARREITGSVKDPSWRWYAVGPGHGLTLQYGPHAGRMVVAADHTLETRNQRGIQLLISDDSGGTWRLGAVDEHSAPDDPIRPDETTAAQLLDGRIYLSSRNVDGAAMTPPLGRGYTYSADSGETVTAPVGPLPGLLTPEVEGSVLQVPAYPQGTTCHPLYYSGPEDPAVRQNLTVRRSDNAGVTWRDIAVLTAPGEHGGYSDLVPVDRTHLGDLFEEWAGPGTPTTIAWRIVPLSCP